MTYQDIQYYADMLYEARIGIAPYKEVMHTIYRAKPTASELSAIQVLAEYYGYHSLEQMKRYA